MQYSASRVRILFLTGENMYITTYVELLPLDCASKCVAVNAFDMFGMFVYKF